MPGFYKFYRGRLDEIEKSLIRNIIGELIDNKKINLNKMNALRIPDDVKRFRIANFSLPLRIVGIPENPMSGTCNKSILIHEIFHQMQYRKSFMSFIILIFEQIVRRMFARDVYDYGCNEFLNGDCDIKTLDDIRTREGQAGFVQDFAYNYLSYLEMMNVHESLDVNKKDKLLLYKFRAERYACVLKNSGLDSEAIREMAG